MVRRALARRGKSGNADLITFGSYLGNIVGFFTGLGHPIVAAASGVESLLETRNPQIQRGRAGPYVRLTEILCAPYTAVASIGAFSSMITAASNGRYKEALLYCASTALSTGMTYVLGKKVTRSYGGLTNIPSGVVDDITSVLRDGNELYEKTRDTFQRDDGPKKLK